MKETITMNWKITDEDNQKIVFTKTVTTNDWNEIRKARTEVFQAYKNYVTKDNCKNFDNEIIIYEDDMDEIMFTNEFEEIEKEIRKIVKACK